MINLNLQNVEELVFYDKKIQQLLPEFKNLFNSWALAVQSSLRGIAKKSISDFLNQLTPEHIKILENYFSANLEIDKLDYRIVRNYSFPLDEINLDNVDTFSNVFLSRDDKQVHISFWR